MSRHLLLAGLFVLSAPAFAEDAKKDSAKKEWDPKAHIEMHEKMADAHKKAAECLKAGKPTEECRTQFKQACHDAGQGACPGMMGKGKGKGMGMHHDMN